MDIDELGDYLFAGWEMEEENSYSDFSYSVLHEKRTNHAQREETWIVERIIDRRTKEKYLVDKPLTIALKSFTLLCVMPFYGISSMFTDIVRIPSRVAYQSLQGMYELVKSLIEFAPLKSVHVATNTLSKMISHSLSLIYEIVRTPFYTIGMMFAAVYGIISPYYGRAIVSHIEKKWNHNEPFYKDWFRNMVLKDRFTFVKECVSSQEHDVYYLAPCFQSRIDRSVTKPDFVTQ